MTDCAQTKPNPTRWAHFSALPIMKNWAGPIIFNCAQAVSCLPQVLFSYVVYYEVLDL